MNSSDKQTDNIEQGRAIARGIDELNTQKEKNVARELKRTKSMIKNAAEKELFH